MGHPRELPTKLCAACGRRFAWRKAWERSWAEVRYCSNGCRKSKPDATDRALEQAILSLLDERDANASICPSEAARRVEPEDWKPLMERARRAGRRLAAEGRVEFTQKGRVVDPSEFRGPVRLRCAR